MIIIYDVIQLRFRDTFYSARCGHWNRVPSGTVAKPTKLPFIIIMSLFVVDRTQPHKK